MSNTERALDWLLLGVVVFVLTAGRAVWAAPTAPWWSPFALWGAMVGLGALRVCRRQGDADDA